MHHHREWSIISKQVFPYHFSLYKKQDSEFGTSNNCLIKRRVEMQSPIDFLSLKLKNILCNSKDLQASRLRIFWMKFRTFLRDLSWMGKYTLEFQNISCMKSWNEGHRIHQLGSIAYLTWITDRILANWPLGLLTMPPSWWIGAFNLAFMKT